MRPELRFFTIFLLYLSCQSSTEQAGDDQFETFENDTPVEENGAFETPGDSYEDPGRSEWQNPALVIDKLGELEGKTVADIGAGTGYFSFRLAREGARVIAIDIEREYLEYIDKRLQESMLPSGSSAVETRLSEENDPLLQPGEADVVLLVNTYTYLSDRVSYLEKVKEGMAENGLIAIVDYKTATNPVVNDAVTIVMPRIVQNELEQAGFSDVVIDRNSLQYQYIITAKK